MIKASLGIAVALVVAMSSPARAQPADEIVFNADKSLAAAMTSAGCRVMVTTSRWNVGSYNHQYGWSGGCTSAGFISGDGYLLHTYHSSLGYYHYIGEEYKGHAVDGIIEGVGSALYRENESNTAPYNGFTPPPGMGWSTVIPGNPDEEYDFHWNWPDLIAFRDSLIAAAAPAPPAPAPPTPARRPPPPQLAVAGEPIHRFGPPCITLAAGATRWFDPDDLEDQRVVTEVRMTNSCPRAQLFEAEISYGVHTMERPFWTDFGPQSNRVLWTMAWPRLPFNATDDRGASMLSTSGDVWHAEVNQELPGATNFNWSVATCDFLSERNVKRAMFRDLDSTTGFNNVACLPLPGRDPERAE